MEELLESWKVSQDTIKAFRDNNVDLTCLDGIEEEELKILIPESELRDRIKFKQGLKKYREEIETVHSNTDSLDTDLADSLSLSSCELFTSDKTDQSKELVNNGSVNKGPLAISRRNYAELIGPV